MAVLLFALAVAGPAARQACGPASAPLDDDAALMAGYMPRFQSGDALPAIGVFELVLQPVADVIYLVKLERADVGGYGGIVTIENVAAGRYRIIFSNEARVDGTQRYALLPSQGSTLATLYFGTYRAIELTAEGGPLTVQVRGATTPLISIAVIRLNDVSVDARQDTCPRSDD